jgi:hypothetical protein
MFSQPYRSSTEEDSSDAELTSAASDAASKATASDSWYDVKSDTEQPQPQQQKQQQQQQQLNQLDKTKSVNVKQQIVNDEDDDDDDEEEEEEEDEDTDDTDDKDQLLIKSINDIYINGSTAEEVENETTTGNDHHDNSIANKQEQQIQKEWIHPYWGDNWKPVTIVKEDKGTSDIQS